MDTLLLFVTVISLAAAFVSVMAVRKLKRHDQLRSDARVAAPVAAADEPGTVAPVRAASTAGARNSVAGEMKWELEPAGGRAPAGIREPGFGIRSPQPEAQSPSPDRFFGTVQR